MRPDLGFTQTEKGRERRRAYKYSMGVCPQKRYKPEEQSAIGNNYFLPHTFPVDPKTSNSSLSSSPLRLRSSKKNLDYTRHKTQICRRASRSGYLCCITRSTRSRMVFGHCFLKIAPRFSGAEVSRSFCFLVFLLQLGPLTVSGAWRRSTEAVWLSTECPLRCETWSLVTLIPVSTDLETLLIR